MLFVSWLIGVTSDSYLIFLGSSLNESLDRLDALPVDLPVAPNPYLISIGIILTGEANSLA